MKRLRLALINSLIILTLFIMFFALYSADAWAANTASSTFRSYYDITMKWFNFLIIIAIFFKYGYKPFRQFIQSEKNKIKMELASLETKTSSAAIDLELAIKKRKENIIALDKLRKQIISTGEKKYQSIIRQAQQQSHFMVEEVQHKTEVNLLRAKKELRNELVDTVIDLAEQKLRDIINEKHNKSLLDSYVKNLQH